MGMSWIPHRRCIAALLAACATGLSARAAAPGFADHVYQSRAFANGLAKLYEEGRCVAVDELDRQLREEKRCELRLPAAARVPRRLEDAYDVLKESVAVVGRIYTCESCEHWHVTTATAFAIHPDGILLTNHHVVDKDDRGVALGVMLYDGRILPVRRVLASTKADDLAVIQVDADDLRPLRLAESCRVGEPVHLISHPVEHFYTLTTGIVSSKLVHGPSGNRRPRLTITADFGKGSSGAPVFDASGAVVGIVHSTTTVFYDRDEHPPQPQMVWRYCIPSTAARALFK
jgi:S1-C subfamily serine protease